MRRNLQRWGLLAALTALLVPAATAWGYYFDDRREMSLSGFAYSRAVIATRGRNNPCTGNLAGQQVGEGAACFERTGMLQQLQLEDDADTVESEIGAVDVNDWCPADVWADQCISPRNGFPADCRLDRYVSLLHGRCYYN